MQQNRNSRKSPFYLLLLTTFAVMALLPARLLASDAPEFAFYLEATNKYYGMFEYTNNAPLSIFNSKATLLVDAPRSFRIGIPLRGGTIPYGPFAFTNNAPIQIGKYQFTLINRDLFDVREKLAQQTAEEDAFRKTQQSKGLVEWNGAWVSSNALRIAQDKEKALLLSAEKHAATIPALERCKACAGLGIVQQGLETIEGILMPKYTNCPACKGTGHEPPAATNIVFSTGQDAPAVKPIGLKKTGGTVTHRLGD